MSWSDAYIKELENMMYRGFGFKNGEEIKVKFDEKMRGRKVTYSFIDEPDDLDPDTIAALKYATLSYKKVYTTFDTIDVEAVDVTPNRLLPEK